MAQVRLWRPGDLPELERMSVAMAFQLTPQDDMNAAGSATIARTAAGNLQGVLQSPRGTALVAEEGGRLVGFILLSVQANDQTGELQGYVADVFVEPAFQRAGIGRDLQRHGEEYFRSLGLRTATLWVHAHNQGAQTAFSRQGYTFWGIVMSKDLNSGAGT